MYGSPGLYAGGSSTHAARLSLRDPDPTIFSQPQQCLAEVAQVIRRHMTGGNWEGIGKTALICRMDLWLSRKSENVIQ